MITWWEVATIGSVLYLVGYVIGIVRGRRIARAEWKLTGRVW